MFTLSTPLYIMVLLVCLLVSMVVHEYMHALVGYKLGDTTAHDAGRLSLNPLQHIDPFMTVLLPIITLVIFQVPVLAAKPVPFNPGRVRYGEYGAAMIAAAGPLSNLVMAFVAAVFSQYAASGTLLAHVLEVFITLNVGLFVFNMLPLPPLDGSRVLYAFAPEPLQRLMEQMEQYGLFLIFALVMMGGFGGLLTNLNHIVLQLLPGQGL